MKSEIESRHNHTNQEKIHLRPPEHRQKVRKTMYIKAINEHGEPIEQELDALDVFVRCAGCGMEISVPDWLDWIAEDGYEPFSKVYCNQCDKLNKEERQAMEAIQNFKNEVDMIREQVLCKEISCSEGVYRLRHLTIH